MVHANNIENIENGQNAEVSPKVVNSSEIKLQQNSPDVMTIEELVASNLSKLSLYENVAGKFGNEEAMRLFKVSTFREFQNLARVKNSGEKIREGSFASPEELHSWGTHPFNRPKGRGMYPLRHKSKGIHRYSISG